jgi:hypothetical protein
MDERVETSTQDEPERAVDELGVGTNASEEAVAWAVAHFGADRDLIQSLRPEARDGIDDRLDALAEDESERLLELDAWRERARLVDRIETRVDLLDNGAMRDGGDRWARRVEVLCSRGPEPALGPSVRAQLAIVRTWVGEAASLEWPAAEEPSDPLGLVRLDGMDVKALMRSLTAIGVWQLAGIVAGQGRRRAARVRSKLPEAWARTFEAGLVGNVDLAIEAATRIQEVYLGLRRRDFNVEQTALRLGLFSLTSAAGGRFERRLDVWLGRAPERIARLAGQLSGINGRATRLRVGPAFRRSLDTFWDYWREQFDPEEAYEG